MKQVKSFISIYCSVACAVVVAFLQVGCEEATGVAGLDVSTTNDVLTVNGDSTRFDVNGVTNELALPLRWSVSDPSLGTITFNSGYMAIYTRFAPNGVNTVMVRDQYGNEGLATVRQTAVAYSLGLAASATSITVGGVVNLTIESDLAVAPFSWRLVSGPGSLTGASGSRSAAYVGSGVGTGVIEVVDANGASAVIAIEVSEVPTDDDDDDDNGTDLPIDP